MVKKLILLLTLLLFSTFAFSQTDLTNTAVNYCTEEKQTQMQEQISTLIRQNADFREFISVKLNSLPDKNFVDEDFKIIDSAIKQKVDEKFGAISALLIAVVVMNDLILIISFLFLRMRGLW